MPDPLATETDYTDRYGPTTDATLAQKLASASNAVRAYVKPASFDPDGESTMVLRMVAGVVRLPRRPVSEVSSVELVNFNGTRTPVVGYSFDGIDRVSVPDQGFVVNLPERAYDAGAGASLEVTWTHGYAEVPAAIVDIVCAAARRALVNPDQHASELVGAYQEAFPGDVAAAGPIGFTAAERSILNDYRGGKAVTVPLG